MASAEQILKALSAIENLRLACSLSYLPKTDAEIAAVLERLNLAYKRNLRVNQMSEGELQRLSM
ncbi:MAG: hypothetical protein PHG27_05430 [Massilibacteroides sp.]|nr:hypothetical protein [Massilibacteroides sp.]MDD3062142.1 hypothetical protein [Massilibacteroides sp.]MDD4115026.1 hypothetical protein [Massilibacteroides sp.]MDD4660297.1 hypothetical protein [Massilibacteroides sp.]